jgi:hypothetical protein
MNYDRFPKSEFDKRGYGTVEAHTLAVELNKQVQTELYELIKPRFREIASELTRLGHDLTEDSINYPECICFREVGKEKGRMQGLILAVDIVITTGYPRDSGDGDMENELKELMSQAENSVRATLSSDT